MYEQVSGQSQVNWIACFSAHFISLGLYWQHTSFSTSSRSVFYLNLNFSSEALHSTTALWVRQSDWMCIELCKKSHKNEFSIRMYTHIGELYSVHHCSNGLALVSVFHLSAWIRVRMLVRPMVSHNAAHFTHFLFDICVCGFAQRSQ